MQRRIAKVQARVRLHDCPLACMISALVRP